MKKLKKISIRGIEEEFYKLTKAELSEIIGGRGDWDCMFNAFQEYLSWNGVSVSKNELVTFYMSYTGKDPSKEGGVTAGDFIDIMMACGVSATCSTMPGSDYRNSILGFIMPGSKIGHFVNMTGKAMELKDGTTVIQVYDPSISDESRRTYWVDKDLVTGYTNMDINEIIDSSVDYSFGSDYMGSPSYFDYWT